MYAEQRGQGRKRQTEKGPRKNVGGMSTKL